MTRKIDHERPKNPNRIYYRFWEHEVWNDDTTPLVPVYCNIVDGCDPTVAVGDFEFCTGACDKNNQPLFENDIVEFIAEDGTQYEYQIVWLQRELCFGLFDIHAEKLMYFELGDIDELCLIGTKMRGVENAKTVM